jgi:hypothetical protein
MLSSKKYYLKRDFAAGDYLSYFVGTESGQIQSVKLLQNMVSNRTQHHPPTPLHTLRTCTYSDRKEEEGGEFNQREG